VAEVVGEMVADDPQSPRRAAELLNAGDIAIVQHEYGIFPGPDGVGVLHLLDGLRIPSVVVLHTVLTAPTSHQRWILEAVAARTDAVVVMTATARDRLAAGYAVDMEKVSVIPHGAPDFTRGPGRADPAPAGRRTSRPTVLTWGLLGPGKGIEWGIEAMGLLMDLDLAPRYVVAGQTHPKVLAWEGERYRDRLRERVRRLGLEDTVVFDDRYRDAASLATLIHSADAILLPYDSTEQVTSGVLIEAVAAHVPIVASRFPHAVELLEGGSGVLVGHKDPAAIGAALRAVLTDGDLVAGMVKTSTASTPTLLWPAVAERYRELASHLIKASRTA
jgi:glycosyltransferase involved in cell wall biosynthesis